MTTDEDREGNDNSLAVVWTLGMFFFFFCLYFTFTNYPFFFFYMYRT